MNERPYYLKHQANAGQISLDPRDEAFYQNPYEAYAYFHANCPKFFWQDYGRWCFGGFDQVNALLRDRRFGRENRWGAPLITVPNRDHLSAFDRVERGSLLELEAPAHTRLRTLVNRAFVSRSVERLQPRIAALAHELIDQFPKGEAFDLLPSFATTIPLIVICELLGVPSQEADHLLNWSHAMCEMYVPSRDLESETRANLAAGAFADFLKAHIKVHRKKGSDDLLSALIAVRDTGEKLSDDELISTCVLLLNAGHEATVHQTGNAVKAILESGMNPAALFSSPQAIAGTVEEALRFDAPLHMFARFAYERVDFGDGVVVEEGEQIGLLLGMANHDPRVFDRPRAFLPERTDQKNVSFGAGIHFCIGAPLARLELQTSLKVLFERLPNLQLEEPPKYRDSFHFHGLVQLLVKA